MPFLTNYLHQIDTSRKDKKALKDAYRKTTTLLLLIFILVSFQMTHSFTVLNKKIVKYTRK